MRLTNKGFEGIYGSMKEDSGNLFEEMYTFLKALMFAEQEHNLDDDEAWEYFLDQLEVILDEHLGQEYLSKFRQNICVDNLIPIRRAIELDQIMKNFVYVREYTEKMVPLTPSQDKAILAEIKDMIGRVSMFIYNQYELGNLVGLDKIVEDTEINVGFFNYCSSINEEPLSTARKIKQILETNLPDVSVFEIDEKIVEIIYSLYPEYVYDIQDLAQYVTYSGVKSVLNCEVDMEDYILSLYKEQSNELAE